MESSYIPLHAKTVQGLLFNEGDYIHYANRDIKKGYTILISIHFWPMELFWREVLPLMRSFLESKRE
jgi:hypothetical protein